MIFKANMCMAIFIYFFDMVLQLYVQYNLQSKLL